MSDGLLEIHRQGNGHTFEDKAGEPNHLGLISVLLQDSALSAAVQLPRAEVHSTDVVFQDLQLREADDHEAKRHHSAEGNAAGHVAEQRRQNHAPNHHAATPLKSAGHQESPVHQHAAAHLHEKTSQEKSGQIVHQWNAGAPHPQVQQGDDGHRISGRQRVALNALLVQIRHGAGSVHRHPTTEAAQQSGKAQGGHLLIY
mmetsp:Transcript_60830/g.99453  ORF Transcript_60830/g.99453 Transcript_60830/m.99453 type:complete len:200 (-) Transcript_60830:352-951(-)